MPEKFLEQMRRTHNTAPSMNGRRINKTNFLQGPPGVLDNGVAVTTGFATSGTAALSTKVFVTQGLAVGPDGEQIRVAMDPNLSQTDYAKALVRDAALVDVSRILESLSGPYSTLDPATHSILLTLDIDQDRIRALKITNAEKAAIDAAIGAGETGDANPDFEAATVDHRARRRGSFKNPETPAGTDGNIAPVNAATEYVLATLTLAGIGTTIATITQRRERKLSWAALIVP